MPKSTWGAVFALGLVVGGLVAIVSLVWIVGLNYCPNGPCQKGNGPYENPADYEYWVPFAVGPNTTSKLEPEDTKGNRHWYEQQDLRAQESVARATNALVYMTGITILIGLVGTGLLVWTLSVSATATEAAVESNKIMRQEQRPWLVFDWEVKCDFFDRGDRGSITWHYDFVNKGKSPAFDVDLKMYLLCRTGLMNMPWQVSERAQLALRNRMTGKTTGAVVFPGERTEHVKYEGFFRSRYGYSNDFDAGDHIMVITCLTYRLREGVNEFGVDARIFEIEESRERLGPFGHDILEHVNARLLK